MAKKTKKKRSTLIRQALVLGAFAVTALAGVVSGVLFAYSPDLPEISELDGYTPGTITRIYDRSTGEISYGRIPAGSVVVPGNLPSEDGKYSLYCAVIVKRVDEKTRAKTSLNELLRP